MFSIDYNKNISRLLYFAICSYYIISTRRYIHSELKWMQMCVNLMIDEWNSVLKIIVK